jgi:hypothetical protein
MSALSALADNLVIILLVLMLVAGYQMEQLKRELRRLSAQLDSIREKLGIIEPLKIPPEIPGLLQAGRKIEAIKVYRQATGAGLAEAKAAVERIADGADPAASRIVQP